MLRDRISREELDGGITEGGSAREAVVTSQARGSGRVARMIASVCLLLLLLFLSVTDAAAAAVFVCFHEESHEASGDPLSPKRVSTSESDDGCRSCVLLFSLSLPVTLSAAAAGLTHAKRGRASESVSHSRDCCGREAGEEYE